MCTLTTYAGPRIVGFLFWYFTILILFRSFIALARLSLAQLKNTRSHNTHTRRVLSFVVQIIKADSDSSSSATSSSLFLAVAVLLLLDTLFGSCCAVVQIESLLVGIHQINVVFFLLFHCICRSRSVSPFYLNAPVCVCFVLCGLPSHSRETIFHKRYRNQIR